MYFFNFFFFPFRLYIFCCSLYFSVVLLSNLLNTLGSPFTVLMDYKNDPSKILITGYKNGHVRAGVSTSFLIDATLTAKDAIHAQLPIGFQQPLIDEIKPRVYKVTFIPEGRPGEILSLEVFYGSQLLHGR